MHTGTSLLPQKAREALLQCDTAEEADEFVKSFISHQIIVIGAILAIPAIILSLSRGIYGPWEPVLTIHAMIIAMIWLVALFRNRLPMFVVGGTFPLAVLAYALTETMFYGLATGSPVFAMFVPVISIPVFGLRRAFYIFFGVLVLMVVVGIHAVLSHHEYLSQIVAAEGPGIWTLLVAAAAAMILSILCLIAFGTLMGALHLRQVTYENLATQTARDKERFDLAMEGSNDGLWDWDLVSNKVYRSDRWYRQIGFTRGEFTDQVASFTDMVHPQDLPRLPEPHPDKIAEAGPTIESEFRLRHRDGSWVPILSRAFVVMKGDKPVRLVGTHIDLSERERLVADLRRVESMLTDGIEALPLGLAFFDNAGRLSLANEMYAEFMDLEDSAVAAQTTFESIVRAHADWAMSQCGFSTPEAFVQARLGSTESSSTWEYQQPSGRIVEIFECATSRGGFMSVVADVTDARRRQAELYQAQKMDAVGKLTGGIAHDFNNLLAVIQGNADVLSYAAPEFIAEIDEIRLATERGADLTQRLLSFSRQQPLQPKSVAPQQLIEDLAPILERSLGEAYDVECDISAETWHILVDPGQLENAILNLAINGRDAMPRGGKISITAQNVRSEDGIPDAEVAPGDYVIISVADGGTGMTEETLSQAFDPFFTTKEVGHGSGLGLAMVRSFARQSGGGVTIETRLGAGTTIRIYLQRARAWAQTSTKPPAKPSLSRGNGETILVVEDDPSVGAMSKQMLETLGYLVTTAEDALTGERILLSGQHFDLVLSDIVLPGGKFGHEMIRDVRETYRDFRVIFMSGYSPDVSDDLRALVESHMMLNKPFSLQSLAEAVQDTLAMPLPEIPPTDVSCARATDAAYQAE